LYGSTNETELILDARLDKLTSPGAGRRDHPRLPARGWKLIVSAVVTATLLVALPGAAAAQASSPTSAQYDDQVQLTRQQAHQAVTQGHDDPTIGVLPFTGVDLVILAVLAIALVGAGVAIQRLNATDESDERA
jgi:hypothetical protein